MANINHTTVTEFVFTAFEDLQQLQIFLFILVLMIYATCVSGNIMIYLLIKLDVSLHRAMYYFISEFAILEIIFVSIIIPKFLDILIAGRNKISFVECFLQLYCADATGAVECCLLAVMTFDRHLAITNPLHYFPKMSQAFTKLAIFPWIAGLVVASVLTIFTASLEYCGPNMINHFFCDLTPLQSLACSNTYVTNMVTSIACIFGILLPFVIIVGFYIDIIIKVLEIKSADGKHKAFSTCFSHLIVSSLWFGTTFIVYIKPSDSQHDKFFAFIYTIVTPLLNPFIYTFRNRDVKHILFKWLRNLSSWIKDKLHIRTKA
ncbi:hypothetical protein GDO78_021060 [Eleutherodactylus coqui]|uniref:Olfactory receptor n=1 Tax=Eleutherodactylus coqui TaxID=57060 RepID=A0A8J6EA22_ELECQ|nr:hypothetical protein GDO78_021060 [Eleutherodactylus coqui]